MESLTDLYGQHQAYLHRHGTFTTNRILKLLQRSDVRITNQIRDILEGLTPAERRQLLRGDFKTRRLIRLRESIRDLAAETRRGVSEVLKAEGVALAAYELSHTEKVMALSIANEIGIGVTGNQAYAAAMSKPMLGRHVRDHVADLPVNVRKQVFAAIREGYVLGETTDQIVRRIKGTAEQRYKDGLLFKRNRGIETVVRTSLTHMAAVSRVEGMRSLGVNKVVYRATLDGRTSKICASLDSKVFEIDKGPRPPQHPNCRSIIQPYIKGDSGGRRPFVKDKRPVKKIPKDERKGKIGQVNSNTNFSKFLERNDGFAKSWLGPTKYKLWKQGNYKIERFVDPRGREYSIADLKRKDAQTFKDLGL